MSSNFNYFRFIYFCLGHVLGTRLYAKHGLSRSLRITRRIEPLRVQDGDPHEKVSHLY